MNDEILERKLRELPAPELPDKWRTEILSAALQEADSASQLRKVYPPLLVRFQNIFARHPWTASAMTALWMLIFLFKASTPVDPSESTLVAHFDPNRPIYIVSLRDELRLAQLWEDQPEQSQVRQIP